MIACRNLMGTRETCLYFDLLQFTTEKLRALHSTACHPESERQQIRGPFEPKAYNNQNPAAFRDHDRKFSQPAGTSLC
jgi:hypothetical protein